MKKCIVCGGDTKRPIAAALNHFRLYESGNWQYLKGNISVFGKYHGLLGTIGLAFPIFDTLKNWKHRKSILAIDGKELSAEHFQSEPSITQP